MHLDLRAVACMPRAVLGTSPVSGADHNLTTITMSMLLPKVSFTRLSFNG